MKKQGMTGLPLYISVKRKNTLMLNVKSSVNDGWWLNSPHLKPSTSELVTKYASLKNWIVISFFLKLNVIHLFKLTLSGHLLLWLDRIPDF